MDNRIIGYGFFGGALIGGMFGLIGGGAVGMGIGAIAGAFIGWFIAAVMMERQKENKEGK